MRLLGLDFEATSPNPEEARPIECGVVLWDTDSNAPLTMGCHLLKNSQYPPLSPEIEELTGITQATLDEFATDPVTYFNALKGLVDKWNVEYFVAHNIKYDRTVLYRELKNYGFDATHKIFTLPWLDTQTDIPYGKEIDTSRKLKHLAMEHGFINPFPHRALTDVMTMLKILANYDINDVIAYSKVPTITVRALVRYEDREKAKAQKFFWDGERKYWLKEIKETKLAEEKLNCKDFEIAKI